MGGADHAYSFTTFGGEPRRCIGENYASGADDGTEIGSNFALTLFKVYEGWQEHVKKIPGW